LGANIELGNSLNLVKPESLLILKEAYLGLEAYCNEAGKKCQSTMKTIDG
jgi:hypothetical protein